MKHLLLLAVIALAIASCKKPVSEKPIARDINTAEKVAVDRFSSTSGHLFLRTATNGLPASNAPINMDLAPFITVGLTPGGLSTEYYNFDVQPIVPEDIYVFFRSGASTPLAGQNNVIPTIPGDPGYNDFWIVNKVIVPETYVPNSLTSVEEILTSGFEIQKTDIIVNCPVVPFGSTKSKPLGGGSQSLTFGWYRNMAVAYFNFDEKALTATSNGLVPYSTIYVMFNDNTLGPVSGFKTETGTVQTHNVLETSPANAEYSPLWNVVVLDNTSFNDVNNLTKALAAPILDPSAGLVNCPVVN